MPQGAADEGFSNVGIVPALRAPLAPATDHTRRLAGITGTELGVQALGD